jgi:hypothetical protein
MGRRERKVASKKKEEGRGRLSAPKNEADTLKAGGPNRTRSRSRLRSGPNNRKVKNEKKVGKKKVGLFVTKELATAIEATKATVERLAKECRLKNRKFR